MKKLALVSIVLLAVVSAQAKNLKALFDYKTFYATTTGTYIETYVSVIGNSVHYKQTESGTYNASVEIMLTIKDATGIKFADKYNLLSPITPDTLRALNFLDNKRIQLPNGTYTIDLTLTDKYGDGKPFTMSQPVKIEFYPNLVAVSDIEFAESFIKSASQSPLNKNGYEVVPLVDNYFPVKSEKLKFYAEVYNTNKVLGNEALIIHYYVQTFETKKIMNDYSVVQRKTAAEVIPVMSEINISQLPSGNYSLVVDVKNRSNDLLTSKDVFFQRNAGTPVATATYNNSFADKYTDIKVLAADVDALHPISNANESEFINNQLNLAEITTMKKFFFDFWQKRNPSDPEGEWLRYKAEVDKVQEKYGSRAIKGHNTDLGRVYLQYGPPNTIDQGPIEPSTYPYVMWKYDKIKNFSNKIFIFYNKDLIGRNYSLLHSDMPGEVNEPQWSLKLHGRTAQSRDWDADGKQIKNHGDKAQENFDKK